MPDFLLLQHDDGLTILGSDTFVVAVDDTGHEDFLDPNHRVFGLGGCAFAVRDYQRLIEKPWNYMCDRFFQNQERPLHASNIEFGAVPDSRFLGLSWYLCARAGSADINKTV